MMANERQLPFISSSVRYARWRDAKNPAAPLFSLRPPPAPANRGLPRGSKSARPRSKTPSFAMSLAPSDQDPFRDTPLSQSPLAKSARIHGASAWKTPSPASQNPRPPPWPAATPAADNLGEPRENRSNRSRPRKTFHQALPSS